MKQTFEDPTKEDINRNLKNVEKGKPLDIPLAVLNGVFKKEYRKGGEFSKLTDEEKKAKKREWRQRPEIKIKLNKYYREYSKRPYVKKKKNEYAQKYRQRPETKAKMKIIQRKYYLKNRVKRLAKEKEKYALKKNAKRT